MSKETAKVIAAGVAPLIAALIAAYQLWFKPRVDEERPPLRDLSRLRKRCDTLRSLRLQLALFIAFVVAVTTIPVVGTIGAAFEIDVDEPVAIEKVLVVLVAVVCVVHVVFLLGRLRAVHREVTDVEEAMTSADQAPLTEE